MAEKSALQRLADNAREARQTQPSFTAEVKALGREAAKDINNTLNQVFFGQGATPGEPGTPMNPTPQLITQDLTGQEVSRQTDMPKPKAKSRDFEMER